MPLDLLANIAELHGKVFKNVPHKHVLSFDAEHNEWKFEVNVGKRSPYCLGNVGLIFMIGFGLSIVKLLRIVFGKFRVPLVVLF